MDDYTGFVADLFLTRQPLIAGHIKMRSTIATELTLAGQNEALYATIYSIKQIKCPEPVNIY